MKMASGGSIGLREGILAAVIASLLAASTLVIVTDWNTRTADAARDPRTQALGARRSGSTTMGGNRAAAQDARKDAQTGALDAAGQGAIAGAPGSLDSLAWPPAGNGSKTFPMSVAVQPACGTRGDAMNALVRTLPDTTIALMVIYPDGDPRQTWYTGQTGAGGRYVLPFVVPPDAPHGIGRVVVTGTHADHDEGAAATIRFVIAERCP